MKTIPEDPKRDSARFYIACAVLAIAKLMLVGSEEIVARNLPHDDFWHILAAARGYWLADQYSNMTLIHLPAYPLWVASVYFTGMPLRIAIELFYIGAAFALVMALRRHGVSPRTRIVAYVLMIFHPVSFQLFNYTLAETFYACLFILTLASLFTLWAERGNRARYVHAAIFGAIVAVLWNTRKESVLIVALMLFVAFLVMVFSRHDWRKALARLAVLVVIPGAVVLLSVLALKSANYLTFGIFASTDLTASGYEAAYNALLRIKPPRYIRFVPVTREARELAYRISPAFAELKPFLETGSGFGYYETKLYMQLDHEIAAGWFYWVFREAAARAGHHTSAGEANKFYRKIADEINTAIEQGRLPSRPVWVGFLDPSVENYLPNLPHSVSEVSRLFTSVAEPVRERDAVEPNSVKAFDIVANRRSALRGEGIFTIRGWAFSETTNIDRVLLRTRDGEVVATTQKFIARPDVVSGFGKKGIHPRSVDIGFSLTMTHSSTRLEGTDLVLVARDGYQSAVPLVQARTPGFTQGGGRRVFYALDEISRPPGAGRTQKRIQSLLWSSYGKGVEYLGWVSVLAAASILLLRRKQAIDESFGVVIILMLFVVVTRIVLFALLDASSWPGNQPRYLFPVMPIYSCLLVVVVSHAYITLRRQWRRSSVGLTAQ